MKPYPISLRNKIITAYKNQEGSMLKLACKYGVSRSFVQKIIKQERTTGDFKPVGNGVRDSKLAPYISLVRQLVDGNNHNTINELHRAIEQQINIKVSRSTVYRFIQKINL